MVSIIHSFESMITDDPAAASAGKVLPSHWNAEHEMSISATKKVIGRNSGGGGDAEEVSLTSLLDWVGATARGDILIRGATDWSRLAVGTNGQVLTSDGTDPAWASTSSLPFSDATPLLSGSSDATKLARFEVDGLTTGTTRVYTLQDRNGTLADDTDLALKAALASPTFTGSPRAPTQSAGDNSTKLATTEYVDSKSQATVKAWGRVVTTNSGGDYTLSFGSGVTVTGASGSQKLSFVTALSTASYVVLVTDVNDPTAACEARSLTTTDFKMRATATGTFQFAVFGA